MKVVISDCYYENISKETEIINSIGGELLRFDCKTEEEVIAAAKDCDALICQFAPITKKVIDSLNNCKVIVRYAIGVDNIDIKAAAEKNIYVCNVPDYCIDEVSNHTIALLMDCIRKLDFMAKETKEGVTDYTVLKPIYRMAGKRLGLAGFGRIPRMVARKLKNFDLDIVVYDPYVSEDAEKKEGVKKVSFDELIETSDYISIHCPLNEETKHMFNRSVFDRMKRGAIIINTARGAIVSEDDLYSALTDKSIAAAGLDVTEHEPVTVDNKLLSLDNVVLTPHIAWYSEEAGHSLQQKVAEEVARVLTGKEPLNPVNKSFFKKQI